MSMSVHVCAVMSEVAWLEQGRASRGADAQKDGTKTKGLTNS